jgi:hypothetical protein
MRHRRTLAAGGPGEKIRRLKRTTRREQWDFR